MKGSSLSCAVIAVGMLSVSAGAEACSCTPQPPPREAMEKASAVFTGEVESIEQTRYGYLVGFRVLEYWKGVESGRVEVLTGFGTGDCGFEFKKGKGYLVYAFGEERLTTGICSRTQKLGRKARRDLDALGEGEEPERD